MKRCGPFAAALLLLITVGGCLSGPPAPPAGAAAGDPQFYRRQMRELVISLSRYARQRKPDFLVIPQNGSELLTADGQAQGPPARDYMRAIDAVGQEDLFFGYAGDNRPSPAQAVSYLLPFLRLALAEGLSVLVIDYCRQQDRVDESYRSSFQAGFLSYAAPRRDLTVIPSYPSPIFAASAAEVRSLAQVRNFLVLINPAAFPSSGAFLQAAGRTDYDLLIVDAFVSDEQGAPRWLQEREVESLKRKSGGARRLVISYLSIGEAEDYRYYWRRSWDSNRDGRPDPAAPSWLHGENPDWQGNYKVRYWDPQWRQLLFGGEDSYLDQILDRGFDGVYLDIIDAFEYFEGLEH